MIVRWWPVLFVLLLLPTSGAQEQVPPEITIRLDIAPADTPLRPNLPRGSVDTLEDTPARLDVTVTCRPDPAVLLPYDGELRISLDAPIFTYLSFSPNARSQSDLTVPLVFDRETCDPERPWTASYELTYHMGRFGYDVLEPMRFEAEATYGLPEDPFGHAEAAVEWTEFAAGWVERVKLAWPQGRVVEVDHGIWLLEDTGLSFATNGRVTVEGVVLGGPWEGRVWFEPARLPAEGRSFGDEIQTYWQGNGTDALETIRFGYRLTLEKDPGATVVFEHPGLGPIEPAWDENLAGELPAPGLFAWSAIVGALLVLYVQVGRRER